MEQERCKLILGDCLEKLKDIPDKSVDLVLTDPPYGVTNLSWDIIPNLDELWKQFNRMIRESGTIIMSSSQPFTSQLVTSNLKMFKYEWIWNKTRAANFNSVKYQPLKMHENFLVFGTKTKYYPIKEPKTGSSLARAKMPYKALKKSKHFESKEKGFRELDNYPSTVLKINSQVGLHPTQKPEALMNYFIKTYTNIGDFICDPFMGSGTTGVSALKLNRRFIGIEINPDYFEIAKKRIGEVENQSKLVAFEQEIEK